jgi:hypothetical protein
MEEEHWRQQSYSERAWDILEYLTEGKVEIPISLIGRMDLINEFTRRGRNAAGLPEIPPKGASLASGPDQPLPPLVKLDIDEGTKKRITQEMADRVLQITLSGGLTSGSRSPRSIATKFFWTPRTSSVTCSGRSWTRNARIRTICGRRWISTTKPSRVSFACAGTVTAPLTLMNNLERIPVRVKDICGVVAGVVFYPRARRNIILRTGSHGRLAELIDFAIVLSHKSPMN